MTIAQEKATLHVKDLGVIDYEQARTIQNEHVRAVHLGDYQTLLLCEHPTVITLGRLAQEKHIIASNTDLENYSVKIINIDRGGDITLHAPGQLVSYPIMNLKNYGKDLHNYLRQLEQVTIDLLSDFDIVANRFPGQTGVWVGNNKIASVGIGVRKWITYHGLAINVNTDLNHFAMIKPCGLDVQMTSMSKVKNQVIDMMEVKQKIVDHFCLNFNINE